MTDLRLSIGTFLVGAFVILQASYIQAAARWAEVIRETGTDYYVEAVEPTGDGGYILVGMRVKGGQEEAWCVKLDALGNVTWQHTYGEAGYDAFADVRPMSDGTYFVTGGTESFGAGSSDVWCLLLDATGNVIWQKAYGGAGTDFGFSGEPLPGGGFVVAGYTDSFGAGMRDLLCMRLDAAGNVIWQKAYGGANDDSGHYVQRTSDNGFIIAGRTKSFSSGNTQLWCLKLDSSGQISWQKAYGLGTSGNSRAIQQTSDGGYIMSGLIGGAMLDSYVLKLAANGAVSWQTFIQQAAPGYPLVEDVRPASTGGYIAVGSVRGGSGSDDVWFAGLGANGNIIWQKSAGGDDYDSAECVRPTIDGGFVTVGKTIAGSDDSVFVSRHSAAGDLDAACNMQNTGVAATSSSIVAVTTSGTTTTATVAVANTIRVAGAAAAFVEQSCSSPAAPDLSGSWSGAGLKRSKLKATFTCRNMGAAAAGSSIAKVYLSKKSTIGRKATLIKTQSVAGLAAFGTSSFKISTTPASKYKYVIAALDAGSTVAEDDEANNIVAWRFR